MDKESESMTQEKLEETQDAILEAWGAVCEAFSDVWQVYYERWHGIHELLEEAGLVKGLPVPPMPDPAREAAERRVEEWINGERACL